MLHESKRLIGIKLAPLMKAFGYQKRLLNWHKQTSDTILVLHIGQNRWGTNRYDITLGVYIKKLGIESSPPIHRCHINAFFEKLVPDIYEFRQVCDFDYPSFTSEERLEHIYKYVSVIALPWLESHSTIVALRQIAKKDYQHLLAEGWFIRAVYDYLHEEP